MHAQGRPMIPQPSAANSPSEVADEVDEAALDEVMRVVPLGRSRRSSRRLDGARLFGDLSVRLPRARPGGLAVTGQSSEAS